MFDKFLYLYSTGFVALLVASSALNPDRGPSTFIIGIIFAPVALYLIFSLIQYIRKPKSETSQQPSSPLTSLLNKHQADTTNQTLDLKPFTYRFFNQSHPLFLVTLVLVLLALSTTLLKSGTSFGHNHPARDNSLVSQINKQPPVSPLSQP